MLGFRIQAIELRQYIYFSFTHTSSIKCTFQINAKFCIIVVMFITWELHTTTMTQHIQGHDSIIHHSIFIKEKYIRRCVQNTRDMVYIKRVAIPALIQLSFGRRYASRTSRQTGAYMHQQNRPSLTNFLFKCVYQTFKVIALVLGELLTSLQITGPNS